MLVCVYVLDCPSSISNVSPWHCLILILVELKEGTLMLLASPKPRSCMASQVCFIFGSFLFFYFLFFIYLFFFFFFFFILYFIFSLYYFSLSIRQVCSCRFFPLPGNFEAGPVGEKREPRWTAIGGRHSSHRPTLSFSLSLSTCRHPIFFNRSAPPPSPNHYQKVFFSFVFLF